jgi:hydrogenase nickel incorporation protein HypA/HybF
MHELSIAQAVVAIVARHAGGRTVHRVELRVGHLRQVGPAALEFSWQLLTEGTALERAELVIEAVPVSGRCRKCQAETTMNDFPLRCGHCGGLDVELVTGEELLVDALELEENVAPKIGGMAHGG